MPIYEYRCEKCGNDFEELVGPNESAPPCPLCDSKKVEKLLSRSSFRSASSDGDFGGCDSGSCDFGGCASGGGGCGGCTGGDCSRCH